VRVIGVVGGAHFVSHFFQLTLPPLFPLLRDDFGVTYIQLGLVMSLFYASSGIGQTASGFLVDHFGARRVLPAGMALVALATALAGLARSYWALVAVALLGGLGNSVFHPADYSILNATVSARRIARAYSLHQISGNAGWVIAPLSASTPHGTWESAMNDATSGLTSAANAAGNLALSRNRYPS